MTEYNKDSVNKAIKSSKSKISKKEGSAIHRLLIGRRKEKPFKDACVTGSRRDFANESVTKRVTLSSLKKIYDNNETENAHSENAVLLAKHFGTEEEHRKMKHALNTRNKLGYLHPDHISYASDMSKKYYRKLLPMRESHNLGESAGKNKLDATKNEETLQEISSGKLKDALSDVGHYADDVSVHKGVATIRKSFFYKHGDDERQHQGRVLNALVKAGIKHKHVESGEVNKPFRGGASVKNSSHFYTKVGLGEITDPSSYRAPTRTGGNPADPLLHYLRTGMVLVKEETINETKFEQHPDGGDKAYSVAVTHSRSGKFIKSHNVKAKNIRSAERHIRSKYPAGHKAFAGYISIYEDAGVGAADVSGPATAGSDYQTKLSAVGKMSPKQMRKKANNVKENVISTVEQIEALLESYKPSDKLLSRTKYLVQPKLSKTLRARLAARGAPKKKGYTASAGTLGLAAQRKAQMSGSKKKKVDEAVDPHAHVEKAVHKILNGGHKETLMKMNSEKLSHLVRQSREAGTLEYAPNGSLNKYVDSWKAKHSVSEGIFSRMKKSASKKAASAIPVKKRKESDTPPRAGDYEYDEHTKKYYTTENEKFPVGTKVTVCAGNHEGKSGTIVKHLKSEYHSPYPGTEHHRVLIGAARHSIPLRDLKIKESSVKLPSDAKRALGMAAQSMQTDRKETRERSIIKAIRKKDWRVPNHYNDLKANEERELLTDAKKKPSKLKRKYMGVTKGRTATGKPAHAIEIDPKINSGQGVANRMTGAIK